MLVFTNRIKLIVITANTDWHRRLNWQLRYPKLYYIIGYFLKWLDKVPSKAENILALIYLIIAFLKNSLYMKIMQKYLCYMQCKARLCVNRVTSKLFVDMNVWRNISNMYSTWDNFSLCRIIFPIIEYLASLGLYHL